MKTQHNVHTLVCFHGAIFLGVGLIKLKQNLSVLQLFTFVKRVFLTEDHVTQKPQRTYIHEKDQREYCLARPGFVSKCAFKGDQDVLVFHSQRAPLSLCPTQTEWVSVHSR